MDNLPNASALVRRGPVSRPTACARPHRLTAAARWFTANFPGDVHYAVKANPSPWALDALTAGGVRHFDVASLSEVETTQAYASGANLAFMNPVKSREAISTAYFEAGVRAFALDCQAELEKIESLNEPGARPRSHYPARDREC